MSDSTVKKVSAAHSPRGEMGQKYLVSGKRVSMRLWRTGPQEAHKAPSRRDYETVGYVIDGRAELHLEGQTLRLEAGDSGWCRRAPSTATCSPSPFTAVEATAPPAQVHGRDEPPRKDR